MIEITPDRRGDRERLQQWVLPGVHLGGTCVLAAECLAGGFIKRNADKEQAVKEDHAHADGRRPAELPFGRGRRPQVRQKNPQAQEDDQPFMDGEKGVHNMVGV